MSSFLAPSAPNCPVCDKRVYKMEEILAMNKSWHKTCFTCGINNGDGCGRTMQKGAFLDHKGTPYCNNCYNKNFKARGFGYGSASLSSVPVTTKEDSASTKTTSTHKISATDTPSSLSSGAPKPANRRGSGGSMGLAAMLATQKSSSSGEFITSGGIGAAATVQSKTENNTSKCPVCDKSVYKMEEILAMNKSWHKSCFTCGAQKGDGCKRTMQSGTFLDHDNTPYCNTCYNKNFKQKGYGYGSAGLSTASSSNTTTGSSTSSAKLTSTSTSSVSSNVKPSTVFQKNVPSTTSSTFSAGAKKQTSSLGGSGAPKCPVCSKSVYKMEEILALHQSWHKACFTCGLAKGDGCRRTLQKGAFLDHQGTPYCNSCYNKNFKPKGFGYGSAGLNTDTANKKVEPEKTNTGNITEAQQNFRRGSGGSAAMAARLKEASLTDSSTNSQQGVKLYQGPGSIGKQSSSSSTSSAPNVESVKASPKKTSASTTASTSNITTASTTSTTQESPQRGDSIGDGKPKRRESIGETFQGDGDEVDDSEWD